MANAATRNAGGTAAARPAGPRRLRDDRPLTEPAPRRESAGAAVAPAAAGDPLPLLAVKTLGKALALLDAVGGLAHPPTISEVAATTGLARPTAYRLVQSLVAAGFLVQNPNDQRLGIGYAVLPLASSLLDRNRLRLEALPHLQTLAQRMNERVNLGILHRERVLILGGTEKPNLPTIYSRFGRTVPVHCCALGKAILAFLPEAQARAILAAAPMTARTPRTITSLPDMLEELALTRERGYAIERGENSQTSCCVAVPILVADDEPVGAISVSGRSIDALVADIGAVLGTAELISHRLR